ncbi:MAG: hypothetical protein IJN50_07995 [Clostridia bacterium]|nr:hypothetical protein [Clostridia bacterium]
MSTKECARKVLRDYGSGRVGVYSYNGVLHIFTDRLSVYNADIIAAALNLPKVCINGKMYSNQKEPP